MRVFPIFFFFIWLTPQVLTFSVYLDLSIGSGRMWHCMQSLDSPRAVPRWFPWVVLEVHIDRLMGNEQKRPEGIGLDG